MTPYAAQIVDGEVVQVIVGDAAWAREYLGGEWIDLADKTDVADMPIAAVLADDN